MSTFKAASVVIAPEEGTSLWQPLPSRGYVTTKLTPANMPFDTFSSGIQVLPPGCEVRQHAHARNHELIFIYEGSGICVIDEVTHKAEPGTTILFGRYCQHRLENTGTIDMKLFWVFFPPGLEDWMQAIGKPRVPGEPMPAPFPPPDNVMDVMARLQFIPPPPKP